ncbi:MAG: DUF5674 family protein [Actinomycetota bacterium]|nr:DUF5674 family protein [Actinomycetota bacterium]MDQ6947772.1 DUF5674 family protein [Actinomycetota bacterium]
MSAEPPEPLQLVRAPIRLQALRHLSENQFGDLVKAVVDVGQRIMVIGGELHADEESFMLDIGSRQQELWGINLYPAGYNTDDFIEFDSMINLRPSQGNRTRSVEDPAARQAIVEIVTQLVQRDD